MGILVTGTVALDTVTTPFGHIEEGLGGSATHFSVSACNYTDVHLVAVVGADFPQSHIDFLKSKEIDVSGLERTGGKTFRWVGKYDYDLGNAQTLDTQLNVLAEFSPKVPENLKKPEFLFLANIDPDLQRQVIEACERPQLIAMDTMNFWIEGKREALLKTMKMVDLVTINETEARLLAGESNLVVAARKIRELGPKYLVIKQGEYGALLFYGDHVFSAPGYPLEEIKDPTGAGDSFAGGFMGYLAQKKDTSLETMKQAVIYGSVMASCNVESFSCDRLAKITPEDIKARYAAFKKLTHFDDVVSI